MSILKVAYVRPDNLGVDGTNWSVLVEKANQLEYKEEEGRIYWVIDPAITPEWYKIPQYLSSYAYLATTEELLARIKFLEVERILDQK